MERLRNITVQRKLIIALTAPPVAVGVVGILGVATGIESVGVVLLAALIAAGVAAAAYMLWGESLATGSGGPHSSGEAPSAELFIHLGRRQHALVARALEALTELEANEEDPASLDQLFKVDHLATRLRRNADSLLVLAGADAVPTYREPIELGDVVRGALSEIEAYPRVAFDGFEDAIVRGGVAADLTHLLAELLDNATNFSPPNTPVFVRGRRIDDGYEISIVDEGIGMTPEQLVDATERVASGGAIHGAIDGTTDEAEHASAASPLGASKVVGLHVVGRLAGRHAVRIGFGASLPTGVEATVNIPASLLQPIENPFALPGAMPAESQFDAEPGANQPAQTDPEFGSHVWTPTLDSPLVTAAAPVDAAAPETDQSWMHATWVDPSSSVAPAEPAPAMAAYPPLADLAPAPASEWAPVLDFPAEATGATSDQPGPLGFPVAAPNPAEFAPVDDNLLPGQHVRIGPEPAVETSRSWPSTPSEGIDASPTNVGDESAAPEVHTPDSVPPVFMVPESLSPESLSPEFLSPESMAPELPATADDLDDGGATDPAVPVPEARPRRSALSSLQRGVARGRDSLRRESATDEHEIAPSPNLDQPPAPPVVATSSLPDGFGDWVGPAAAAGSIVANDEATSPPVPVFGLPSSPTSETASDRASDLEPAVAPPAELFEIPAARAELPRRHEVSDVVASTLPIFAEVPTPANPAPELTPALTPAPPRRVRGANLPDTGPAPHAAQPVSAVAAERRPEEVRGALASLQGGVTLGREMHGPIPSPASVSRLATPASNESGERFDNQTEGTDSSDDGGA